MAVALMTTTGTQTIVTTNNKVVIEVHSWHPTFQTMITYAFDVTPYADALARDLLTAHIDAQVKRGER